MWQRKIVKQVPDPQQLVLTIQGEQRQAFLAERSCISVGTLFNGSVAELMCNTVGTG